jgi:hypothetical protein
MATNGKDGTEATPRVFSEAEYRADAGAVVAHALAHGTAIVERPHGSPRVVISIPPAESSSSKP